MAENLKAGVGFRDNDSQLTQFFSGALRFTVELDESCCRVALPIPRLNSWRFPPLKRFSFVHFPVDLPNGVPKRNHVAARRFRSTTGRVLGEFLLVRPEEEFTLLAKTFGCP